jgi:hypothetical protein
LAPRTARARVEITPRRASWPKDEIDIRIALEDASGAVPSKLRMKPRVLLGLQPIGVKFVGDGARLHARVRPRSGSGPWVLRVEVEDQFGVSLGRDFVEIVHEPFERPPVVVRTNVSRR